MLQEAREKSEPNRAKRWDGNGEERRIRPVRVPTGNRRDIPMRMICRGFFHRGQGQWQWVGKRRNSEQEAAELTSYRAYLLQSLPPQAYRDEGRGYPEKTITQASLNEAVTLGQGTVSPKR